MELRSIWSCLSLTGARDPLKALDIIYGGEQEGNWGGAKTKLGQNGFARGWGDSVHSREFEAAKGLSARMGKIRNAIGGRVSRKR